MGSSGSGRITDYPGSSQRKPGGKPSGGGGGGGRPGGGSGGGGTPQDRCARAFSARLEDVERSDYYRAHKAVPPVGTKLKVIQLKRLVAQTLDGESVGNLPTSLNYLASCLKDGWNYVGTIQSASNPPPVANIAADFAATPPS